MKAGARRAVRLVATFGAALLVVGCAGSGIASAEPDETGLALPDVTSSPSDPSLIYPEPPQDFKSCGSVTMHIDSAPATVETLAGFGWDFVVADVVGAEQAIYNTPDGKRPDAFSSRPSGPPAIPDGEPAVYTPIRIDVVSAVRGSFDTGPAQVLVLGGRVGCFTMRVYPVPAIEKGSRYVLALDEVLDSDGKDALPLEEAKLVWPVDPNGVVLTDAGLMSLDELTAVVQGAAVAPGP